MRTGLSGDEEANSLLPGIAVCTVVPEDDANFGNSELL